MGSTIYERQIANLEKAIDLCKPCECDEIIALLTQRLNWFKENDKETSFKELSFNELCKELDYFSVENNENKTIESIADECRIFITKSGHNCLDDYYSDDEVDEWIEENHPEWNTEGFEWTSVNYQPLEFLCEDKYTGDIGFREINITFYGDWDNGVGVFYVGTE